MSVVKAEVRGAPPETAAVERLMVERDREVDELLDAPWWRPGSWWRRPWDSEARKSLARIKASLADLRMLRARVEQRPECERELALLLEPSLRGRSLDTLIELVYALDVLVVRLADEPFLRRRLCAETLDDEDAVRFEDVRAALGNDAPELERAREQLLTTYEMRRFRYRRLRARRRMKSFHLVAVAVLLLGLTLALALSVEDPTGPEQPDAVLLAALAGALGGTLANVIKLRDEISRGTELRAFKPSLVAQPVVGAVAGLVVLLFVTSGVLGTTEAPTGVRWAALTLLAFAAGFSEAMFLGIVRRAAAAPGAAAAAEEDARGVARDPRDDAARRSL